MAFAFVFLALAIALALGGSGGDDSPEEIVGTDGDDTIEGTDNDDAISGGAGNDLLTGNLGNDTLDGGDGNDLLYSGGGNDFLEGGDGNDVLSATGGIDRLFGGNGDDTLLFRSDVGGQGHGGAGNDEIRLIDGNNTVNGGAGDDTILFGEYALSGELLSSTINGGQGDDVLDISVWTDPLNVTYAADGSGTLTDGTATVEFQNIEKLELLEGLHTVDGSATTEGINVAADYQGDAGYRGGYATLIGGSGDDTLEGSGTLIGNDGDDHLIANEHGAILTGGVGADLFEYRINIPEPGGTDRGNVGTTVITDYQVGTDSLTLVANHGVDQNVSAEVIDDLENNQTRIVIGGHVAVILEGVTGLDPDTLNIVLQS